MTLTELKDILKSTGYPVMYYKFTPTPNNPVPPSPPFVVYYVPNSANFMADNKVYKKINDVRIELYTDLKGLAVEEKLESVLDENNIPYNSREVFIESQRLFQKTYEVRLI